MTQLTTIESFLRLLEKVDGVTREQVTKDCILKLRNSLQQVHKNLVKTLYKEVEFTSGIKTTTFTLTADTNLSAVPQDFISFRYMKHNKGDWIYQKDEAFIREICRPINNFY